MRADRTRVGLPETLRARFDAKVQKSDGCWTWIGGVRSNGYGQIDRRGAHRVAYELAFGPIPSKTLVCHRCDNPLCVRPDHLFLGTPGDNSSDMVAKGRQRRGESVSTSRLTAAQVAEIRERYAAGELQRDLGERFGVNQRHISKIVRGVAWRLAS